MTRVGALCWSQVLGGGGRVADYDELNLDFHQPLTPIFVEDTSETQ